MKVKKHFLSMVLLLFAGSFVLIPGAIAATTIATITAFDGEVSILSDYKIVKVTQAGQALKQGDRVQVKAGFATVTFDDGAALNVNPYSSALIQQQEEESGWWVFKVKKTVRRITCFIGKLKFKSGKSIQNNYLQTPTAVAGLRGTEAEVGYDNANNYLNMISGDLAVTYGEFIRGFFENPGVDAATKNQVFQALEAAATASENAAPGDSQAQQAAQVAALEAVQTAAQELTKNPDPVVQQQAQEVVTQTQQQIQNVQAGIAPTATTEAAPTTTVPTAITTTTTTTTTTTSSTTTTTTPPTTTTTTTSSTTTTTLYY